MNLSVEQLRARAVLSPLDHRFAMAMGQLGGERRPEVLLAAAMVSRQVNNGHVCLDLTRLVELDALVSYEGEPVPIWGWPEPHQWLEALRTSPLVGEGGPGTSDCSVARPDCSPGTSDGSVARPDCSPGTSDGSVGTSRVPAATPLVLDAKGRLYLRRYWQHQQRLADALLKHAAQTRGDVDERALARSLSRLFQPTGPADALGVERQRLAAETAARRGLCVITGGPGTGKTSTVVKILALLNEQALARGAPWPRVCLVAPTGKAAARMVQAIEQAKRGLECSEQVKQAIPQRASTIHRCLGAIPGTSTAFRYNAQTPLQTDVLLVDEASMVDLGLMARLLDACPPQARVILLGDKDQLASVEAGAVLADICDAAIPVTDDSRQGPIAQCVVQLTHSYRYASGSGIEALAGCINAGDASGALSILSSSRWPDVSLQPPEAAGVSGRALGEALRRAVLDGYTPYLRHTGVEERLRALDRFRVLCAHRRGAFGAETLNLRIEDALGRSGLLQPRHGSLAGKPILVTRNDYSLGLFNGDVGLILRASEDGGPSLAVFPLPGRGYRSVSASRLPLHETAFAMTVHKSQGSEFGEVVVLLPARASALLSRELLYTAVSRARHRVTVYATSEMVAHAVMRRVERASGLRDALL